MLFVIKKVGEICSEKEFYNEKMVINWWYYFGYGNNGFFIFYLVVKEIS